MTTSSIMQKRDATPEEMISNQTLFAVYTVAFIIISKFIGSLKARNKSISMEIASQ